MEFRRVLFRSGAGLMLLTRQAAGYDAMGTLALKTTAFLCAVVVVFGAAGLVAYILRMRRYRNTTLLLAAASDALADVQLTVGERGEAVVGNRAFRQLIVETAERKMDG